MSQRTLQVALTLIVLGTGLSPALAQRTGQPSVILHEKITVPPAQVARTSARLERGNPIIGQRPGAHQNPSAIASQGKLLAQPRDSETLGQEEIVHGAREPGTKRQSQAKGDYSTAADGQLEYVEVFNPSIVPFKRMSALNAIRDDFTLVTTPGALTDLRVGDDPTPNFDVFWGSIVVELHPGIDVAIPSIAPKMRVLSYETMPRTNVVFSKDEADNFYVRSDEAEVAGSYRLKFLVEADPRYFAPGPLRSMRTMRVADVPISMAPNVPESVRVVADAVLRDMGLDSDMSMAKALDTLVLYFRSFDAKASPTKTGNVYRDLYKSQAGVCRHRSYAFMITASALGIPTRYLTNEAHAWVEVWLGSTTGWARIDLGGAAATLNVHNAGDKSMYRPRSADPFSQPKNYSQNYTRLEGDVRGLRDAQIEERQTPYPSGKGAGSGNGSFFGAKSATTSETTEATQGSDGSEVDHLLTGPGSNLPELEQDDFAGKTPVILRLLGAPKLGYRGESSAALASITTDDGQGLGGLRINVFLAPEGKEGNDALLVGRGVSGDDGLARIEIELPASLPPSHYEVFVSFSGDATYRAMTSN